MRCDLHVHTIASGMFTAPVLDHICRESYNDPHEVYNLLKKRGMSVVTLTDHDSIEAAEALRPRPDFFVSEEVTVRMPSGTEMHLGVYGLTERDHIEVQRRRNDFISLLMYLTERKLFFSANHIFSGLTGRRQEEDFQWFESYVPAYETRNGKMCKEANLSAERLAPSWCARELQRPNLRGVQHRQIPLPRQPLVHFAFTARVFDSRLCAASLGK